MNMTLKSAIGVAALLVAAQAAAQVTFYEREGLRGRSFHTDRPVGNMERFGFNDRAASAVVEAGRWEVCEDARFSGRCVLLQPGRYNTLSSMGLNYQISSVRPVDDTYAATSEQRDTYAARSEPRDAYADQDRAYTVDVASVRAVMGNAQQRCWVDREQVENRGGGNGANVGGAIAGAIIGGVLGHQIGNGRGNDVATAAGAVGGAALGSNLAGRRSDDRVVSTQDVQHCENVPNERPQYWEVTYYFRGQEHRVQMTNPPGSTITVDANGDPRM